MTVAQLPRPLPAIPAFLPFLPSSARLPTLPTAHTNSRDAKTYRCPRQDSCTLGFQCNFAHNTEELQVRLVIGSNFKSRACPYGKVCRFGSRHCRFLHGEHERLLCAACGVTGLFLGTQLVAKLLRVIPGGKSSSPVDFDNLHCVQRAKDAQNVHFRFAQPKDSLHFGCRGPFPKHRPQSLSEQAILLLN